MRLYVFEHLYACLSVLCVFCHEVNPIIVIEPLWKRASGSNTQTTNKHAHTDKHIQKLTKHKNAQTTYKQTYKNHKNAQQRTKTHETQKTHKHAQTLTKHTKTTKQLTNTQKCTTHALTRTLGTDQQRRPWQCWGSMSESVPHNQLHRGLLICGCPKSYLVKGHLLHLLPRIFLM